MRRREFITLLGGTAVWPMAAQAQQAGKLPTIGFLSAGGPSQNSQWVAAFVQRLRELGWIEGRTIAIEYRWGEARIERFAEFAAELVRLKVDVIVTQATRPVVAAKQATAIIPIVFVATGDPVGAGLVVSLNRPGGNVTGLSLQNSDLAGKRVELLREVVPALRRLAILSDIGNPSNLPVIGQIQAAARTLGLEVVLLEILRAEDIAPAFERLWSAACRFSITIVRHSHGQSCLQACKPDGIERQEARRRRRRRPSLIRPTIAARNASWSSVETRR